jgi:putative colanic acid biosynthesis acetyltransferase WcaF
LGRLAWGGVQALVFPLTFRTWFGLRVALLKLFGARLGRNVRISRTAVVAVPWRLNLADDVSIGEHVILYSLGEIKIGSRSFVSQYAHLCAGTHDYTSTDYPLLKLPITIGDDCWIAADVFVGPDVTIGDRSVIGARSTVTSDIPPDVVAVGAPAKAIKPRVLHGRGGESLDTSS